jgi:hypothetical protein
VDLEPPDFDRLLVELVTCTERGRSVDELTTPNGGPTGQTVSTCGRSAPGCAEREFEHRG